MAASNVKLLSVAAIKGNGTNNGISNLKLKAVAFICHFVKSHQILFNQIS